MDYVKLGERYCMDDYRMHMILMVFVRAMIAPNEMATIYGLSGTGTIIDGMKQFRKKLPSCNLDIPKWF